MPVGPIKTKAQKQKVVQTEMHKFKGGALHSGSKHGPVVTNPKQAIAISLSESGQAKGKPGGKDTPFHNVRHSPGGPANNDGYTPKSSHVSGAGHAKQPKGSPIGLGTSEGRHKANQTYAQEQVEHWGNKAKGHTMGNRDVVANVGAEKRGSELNGQCGEEGNAKQPGGSSIGVPSMESERRIGDGMGGAAHCFPNVHTSEAHTFGHSGGQKRGVLRMSGHSGAHMLGARKK